MIRLSDILLEKLKDDVTLQRISMEDARKFIESHYLGVFPGGGSTYYGVVHKTMGMVGLIVYGNPTKPTDYKEISINKETGESLLKPNEVVELLRLYFPDEIDIPNITSYTISAGNKKIKEDRPHVKVIITRADSGRHVGTVYQATNAMYLGKSKDSTRPFDRERGVEVRADDYLKYGFESMADLRKKIEDNPSFPVELRTRSGKHKYIYIVADSNREKNEIINGMVTTPLPYPKQDRQ